MVLRVSVIAILTFVVGLLQQRADAEQLAPLLPLPELKACQASVHPRLPENWRGVFLMAPFTNAQLVVSEIEYDGSIPAMRARLYGLRSGALDLFVEGSQTYEISSQDDQVTSCHELGDTGWRPLPQDWLAEQSQCAGTAPLGKTDVDWWKTPTDPAPSTYWIWYNSSDKAPFRLAFQKASNRLAPLSKYALSYQLHLEQRTDSNLGDISRFCHRSTQSAPSRPSSLDQRIAALSSPKLERATKAIEKIAPEIAACPSTPLPNWPDKLAITGLMTPWDFDESPYATEVFYDWTQRAQRTRTFPYSPAPFRAQDALLLRRRGYNVTYRHQGLTCEPVLPGVLKPDWSQQGSCSCEAMLAGSTAFTPYGTSRVFTCPLASPRATWAWYSLDGRPTSFAVTSLPGDQGFGLFAVLDYRDWLVGDQAPPHVFDAPRQCQAHGVRIHADTSKCSACHLGDVRINH